MILYKISYHMVLMILYDMMIYSGLCFGTWMDYFSIQLGTILSHLTFIFCRGVGQPPTRESRYESTLSMNQDETRWYQDDNNHIQSYSITLRWLWILWIEKFNIWIKLTWATWPSQEGPFWLLGMDIGVPTKNACHGNKLLPFCCTKHGETST